MPRTSKFHWSYVRVGRIVASVSQLRMKGQSVSGQQLSANATKNSVRGRYDVPLIAISLSVVGLLVIALVIFPDQSNDIAESVFGQLTAAVGTPTLIITFAALVFLVCLAMSKFGNIRLGDRPPQFSTKSWVAMMLTAGLGSATVYWAFIEWAFYYTDPGFPYDEGTTSAYEWALSYNFFHWGLSAWSIYCIAALPLAYHFYVRRRSGLNFSSVVRDATGLSGTGLVGKLVDVIFIFTTLGGLSITIALSLPLLTEGVADVLGMESNKYISVAIVVIVCLTFILSSIRGLEKGVKKLTDYNSILALIFIGAVFIIGPTAFIINNTTNGLGQMFQNFVHMSLWTDPIEQGGFPENWTIFYWLYWVSYAPFMGIFVARVSAGRTIREVIANMLISGSLGCWLFFGVLQNFSMDLHIKGIVDMTRGLDDDGGNSAIIEAINTLPWGSLFVILFVVVSILFLASTLDSASYTLSFTSSRGLTHKEDPSRAHRLFWCLMIVVVPVTLVLINASLNTVQTVGVIMAVPLIVIILIMIVGFVRSLRKDFGDLEPAEIKKSARFEADGEE